MTRDNSLGLSLVLGAAACLAATAAWTQTRELGSSGELVDGIAAVVDDGVVLKSELEQRLTMVVNSFRQQQAQLPPAQRSQLPPLSVLERQVLDQLVLEQIQLQRADRLGIVIGDDLLNQLLGRVANNLGITFEQLPAALASENIDYATYRQDQRNELIITQLEQNDVLGRISIAPRELSQCLARLEVNQSSEFDYDVSHILIGFSQNADSDEVAEAQARAFDIIDRLDAGGDFAQLALTYSESQTALQGGSLGWRKGSELPSMFAEQVTRLEPGEHSQPIRTSGGFQIVRLNDMRGAERVVVDQLHLRHILITPNEVLDDDATRQKMLGIREQIVGGDDFEDLAETQSEDPGSAAEGGDLGWVQLGDDLFVPEFEEEIRKLEVGEISQPFQTRYGWHIAQVTDTRTYDTTDELKEQRCQREIRVSKAEEERELWLRRLRDQAFVDIRL